MVSPVSGTTNGIRSEHGTVFTYELAIVATVVFIGMTVGLSSLRDAVIGESSDFALSMQLLNQSYSFAPPVGTAATTNGSAFSDAGDMPDEYADPSGEMANCIVLVAALDETPVAIRITPNADDVSTDRGRFYDTGAGLLHSNARITYAIDLPTDGVYRFSAGFWAHQAGTDLANVAFELNGTTIQDFDVASTDATDPETHQVSQFLPAGSHTFTLRFTNDSNAGGGDRNLFINWLEVVGPF